LRLLWLAVLLVSDLRVLAVVAVVVALWGIKRTAQSRLRKHGAHVLAWRWLTGAPWHGKPLTDAGWLRSGTQALTPTGHASRWQHKPRLRRAAWRSGGTIAALLTAMLLAKYPRPTALALASVVLVALAAGAVLAVRALLARKQRRTWLVPLHLAAHQLAGVPRAERASSWISVDLDGSGAVTGASLALPPGWPAEQADKQRLVAIASAKLGIEAPEASWRLAGPSPQLALRQSEPPPLRVSLADLMPAIDKARPDDLVWGIGKQGRTVATSLSGDSPHLGLSMGSGAGKSVTARALLAQRLYRGDIGLILDYKMISHQWARDLPNVVIARRPHEIHRALLWLGNEVERRNEVALAGADIDGNVHSVVGPRLIVVCEELNAMMSRLRKYWAQVRDSDDPKRSPAIDALDAASFMGRQVLVNIIYIGQRLSVKASGGDGDARENIGVIGFGRYSASNWKMLAGDHPMPPKSLTPGRLQVVTDRVRETQAVFMPAREARRLALAGTMTPVPAGMPGAKAVSGTSPELLSPGADQPVVSGNGQEVLTPGGMVTLSEAVAEGIVSCSLHAIRKASQRPGFPPRKSVRGLAGEWDALDLAEWSATRKGR
jgi:hypothetical protein